ncbi:19722_t:CDS:2, partial [Racocetra fulgida]
ADSYTYQKLEKLPENQDDEYDDLLKTAEKELYESDFYYYLVRVYANKKLVPDNNQTTTTQE